MKWKRALNFPFRVHVNSDVSHASPFVMPLLHSRDQICTPACMQSRMYKRLPCYLCEGRIRHLFLRSALFLVRPGVIHCARITPIAASLSLFLSLLPFFRVFENGTRQRFYTRLSRKDSATPHAAREKAPFPRHATHPPICKTITSRCLREKDHRNWEKRQVTDVESRASRDFAHLKSNVDVSSLALIESETKLRLDQFY